MNETWAWIITGLVIEAFFSGSEIALLSSDRLALKLKARSGSKTATLALDLLRSPEKILSTTLLMTSFCVVWLSLIFSIRIFHTNEGHSSIISILTASTLIVIFGELLPKTLFQRFSDSLVPWVIYPILFCYYLFLPITGLLALYTGSLSRMLSPLERLILGRPHSARDNLRVALAPSKVDSDIKPIEKRMIRKILDFKDSPATKAAIPLVRVDGIDKNQTVREALEAFQKNLHSRMPVYSGRIDNIVGIIQLIDIMGEISSLRPVSDFMKPAFYSADTQSLEDLFIEMNDLGHEMSIIVNEHGGAIGLVTFEDVAEEIVGELSDEFDPTGAPIQRLSDSSWIVNAQVLFKTVNDELDLKLPDGEYETIAGFLLHHFKRIPERGDEIYLNTNAGSLRFRIRLANEKSVQSVLVEKRSLEENPI